MEIRFQITGMTCAACSARVEKVSSCVKGADRIEVNLLAGTMTVEAQSDVTAQIEAAVKNAGYGAYPAGGKKAEKPKADDLKPMKIRIIGSAVFLAILMYFTMGHMAGLPMPHWYHGQQNAVVAAHSLGLGSCYIGDITENFEYHKELLNLPQYVVPAAMLCFGYPTRQQLEREKPVRFQVEDIVHENGYSKEKADAMPQMLSQRNGKTGEEFGRWMTKFRQFKWDSEFSREMSRSCGEMVRHWCGEKE